MCRCQLLVASYHLFVTMTIFSFVMFLAALSAAYGSALHCVSPIVRLLCRCLIYPCLICAYPSAAPAPPSPAARAAPAPAHPGTAAPETAIAMPTGGAPSGENGHHSESEQLRMLQREISNLNREMAQLLQRAKLGEKGDLERLFPSCSMWLN